MKRGPQLGLHSQLRCASINLYKLYILENAGLEVYIRDIYIDCPTWVGNALL